jgi:tripartite-type tricarboxylate transporter receptor subunit TctC
MRTIGTALCLLLVSSLSAISADNYPSKPIRMIVAYAAGGAIDALGRAVSQQMSIALGQPIIVENRPGAGGILAADLVARSAPDGYTLLLTDPAIATSPSLQRNLPYDLFKDFQAVSIVGWSPTTLVVNKFLPVSSVNDLIEYAKAKPGVLKYASAGAGTPVHLAAELLKIKTGIEIIHVPYRGMTQAMMDIISGDVQLAFSGGSVLPFVNSGQMRALATSGLKRSVSLPQLPTIQEAGVADFYVDLWTALFAPAGVPSDVVNKLVGNLRKALGSEEVKGVLAKIGTEAGGTSSDEAVKFVRAEHDKWRALIREANIQP